MFQFRVYSDDPMQIETVKNHIILLVKYIIVFKVL